MSSQQSINVTVPGDEEQKAFDVLLGFIDSHRDNVFMLTDEKGLIILAKGKPASELTLLLMRAMRTQIDENRNTPQQTEAPK